MEGDKLQYKANLRLPIIATFEHFTVPSKQICYKHNVWGNRRDVWEIISFYGNVVGSTNAQFHSLHPLPSHRHQNDFSTSALKLSSLVPTCPVWGTTTAVCTVAMTHPHLHCWINGVQALLKSPREEPEDSAFWGPCAFSSDTGLSKKCMSGKEACPDLIVSGLSPSVPFGNTYHLKETWVNVLYRKPGWCWLWYDGKELSIFNLTTCALKNNIMGIFSIRFSPTEEAE